MTPGTEIGLRIDQTLTQDAIGTMVMLELEALALDRVRTEVSVQYVDHNLLQSDERNMADHLFLRSACQRFGLWFSRPGNGVSHPVHMQRFGRPGASLAGSDSHTCAAGSLGMLAIGVGGLEVAMAMAGEPLYLTMPEIWGVRLTGELPPWVSAKDVILEMLRRHGVQGGRGRIIEYHGPGLASLSAMDRHVIANRGAELGATTSVFPADAQVRAFLAGEGRPDDFTGLTADDDASYDVTGEIDLASLEPLIARPTSPGNVVPVREVAGAPVFQVARIHQAGCMGCIGMGQAPAIGRNSLRTVPRNFPGRSGTSEDAVWLCSPETAAAAALTGTITDPRELPSVLGIEYPRLDLPAPSPGSEALLERPLGADDARQAELVKAPSIGTLPDLDPLPGDLRAMVAIKVGDDISTDEILPAGARVLPFRSDIARLAEFTFSQVDEDYVARAREAGAHVVVAGDNYGQGSSREHAVIAPRSLGLRLVLAKSYARIHWQNLANFGVLAAEFTDPADYDRIDEGDELRVDRLPDALGSADGFTVRNETKDQDYAVRHRLSPRQVEMVRAGGQIPLVRGRPST